MVWYFGEVVRCGEVVPVSAVHVSTCQCSTRQYMSISYFMYLAFVSAYHNTKPIRFIHGVYSHPHVVVYPQGHRAAVTLQAT